MAHTSGSATTQLDPQVASLQTRSSGTTQMRCKSECWGFRGVAGKRVQEHNAFRDYQHSAKSDLSFCFLSSPRKMLPAAATDTRFGNLVCRVSFKVKILLFKLSASIGCRMVFPALRPLRQWDCVLLMGFRQSHLRQKSP